MNFWKKFIQVFKSNMMLILLLIGILLGVILGLIIRQGGPYTSRQHMYFGLPGDIFLQMLQGITLPLIITCLVSAFGSLEKNVAERIGSQFFVYFVITKIIVITIALVMAFSIRPGGNSEKVNEGTASAVTPTKNLTVADTLLDIVRNLFPRNYMEMTMKTYVTHLIPPPEGEKKNKSDWNIDPVGIMDKKSNMLGVVTVSILIGIGMAVMGPEVNKPMLDFVVNLSYLTFNVVNWILWTAPFLLISLIGAQVIKMENLGEELGKLGLYLVCLACTFTLAAAIIFPLMYFLIVRQNPFWLIRQNSEALLTAVATSSSLACLPVQIRCLENNCNFDSRLVRFIVPVSTSINKDGTAIYHTIGAIFISQMSGTKLVMGQLVGLYVLCIASSVSTATVPYGALICLVMVLEGLGLPADIGLLMAVEWLKDRMETMVNVTATLFAVAILSHYNQKLLQKKDLFLGSGTSLIPVPIKELISAYSRGRVSQSFIIAPDSRTIDEEDEDEEEEEDVTSLRSERKSSDAQSHTSKML